VITVRRTITVGKPAAAVFAYLSDFATAVEWDPGTVSCRRIKDGSPQPTGLGAEYENVSRFKGRETTLRYRVERFEPERTIALRGRNKTVTSVDTISLVGHDGSTEVGYQADFSFNGVARFAEPLLRKSLEKLADDAEQSMRAALSRL
jgi:carbon monoxide dehydrogenase subunit G